MADITIEVVQPPQRELNVRPGTTLADMKAQIARISSHADLALDQDSANLLKCARVELGIDPHSQASPRIFLLPARKSNAWR